MRLTPFDILIIAVLIYLLVRMVLGKKRGGGQGRPGQSGGQQPSDPESRRQASDAYRRAQQAWDMLRTDEPAPAQAPAGDLSFDEQEFIAGAKLMCARIRESWDSRDLDDLKNFCTPAAMAEFERRAESETRPARAETLLINARLMEVRTRQDGQEESTVLYEILEKEPGSGQNREAREIWRFVRPAENPEAMWKLDGTRPADKGEGVIQ